MNLKHIIEYRDNCPICNHKLLLNSKSLKAKIFIEKDALLLKTKSNEIRLFFDDRYESASNVFRKNIKFSKQCANCSQVPNYDRSQMGLSGAANLANITLPKYFYIFNVSLNSRSVTTISQLSYESFHYAEEDRFYAINVDYLNEQTGFMLGDIKNSFDQIVLHKFDNIIDMSNVKCIEDLNKKIRMFSLFL